MSGETEANVSGWTVDTLHSHMLTLDRAQAERALLVKDELNREVGQMGERNQLLQEELDRRLLASQEEIDRRVATIYRMIDNTKESGVQHLQDLRSMLDERYATQTKALDAAFLAQQTAMKTAFDAADKAVAAALESAEKAVVKAETAAEKRFESVNEFRAQLTDQAATFISRQEFETVNKSLVDKFETTSKAQAETAAALNARNVDAVSAVSERVSTELTRSARDRSELELRLTSRLNSLGGEIIGTEKQKNSSRLDIGTILQFLSVVAAVVAVLVVAFHH